MSTFPSDIDDRHFFSDVSLKHAEVHNRYNELIKSGQYQEASQYLYNNAFIWHEEGWEGWIEKVMDYNGAYLWNQFDEMIAAIEDYAINMDRTTIRPYYNTEEPTETYDLMVWIADDTTTPVV